MRNGKKVSGSIGTKTHFAGILLIVIYVTFISLGLPDSLLGAVWPVMRMDYNVPLSAAGIVSMIIAGGTILSSMKSGSLIARFGTGKVVLVSVALTACALLGIAHANIFIGLVMLAIPLGLGAGAIDASLNHFVAAHYKVHHMNWLHAFWGIGATMGPLILLKYLSADQNWRGGYLAIASLQFGIVVLLIVSRNLWKTAAKENDQQEMEESESKVFTGKVLGISGVKPTLVVFFLYCSAETVVGLWGASYLVEVKGILPEIAAGWVSFYYGGITFGRILSGFISFKIKNRHLILLGQVISILGILVMHFSGTPILSGFGILLVGMGLAPIFPGLLHETPFRFGKNNSAKLMGYQMAAAYTGTTLMPPIIGVAGSAIGLTIFPWAMLVILVSLTLLSEWVVNRLRIQS